MATTHPQPGTIANQYNRLANGQLSKRPVRQVKVIATNGNTVTVIALNGPVAGTTYEINADVLAA